MTVDPRTDRPVLQYLHPAIYRAIVGFALWLILSVWLFFGRDPYEGFVDAVVTGLVAIVVLIPLAIWITWRRNSDANGPPAASFRDWRASQFQTWSGLLTGTEAGVQVLLPIAVVALGMTAFGIVLYFTASGAA